MLPILDLAQQFYFHISRHKKNLTSANLRLVTQAELRLFTLMRECTAIINILTEYEFLILVSKHTTVLFTDHKPIVFLFTLNLITEYIEFNLI